MSIFFIFFCIILIILQKLILKIHKNCDTICLTLGVFVTFTEGGVYTFYENELLFLCASLKKLHIRVLTVSPDASADKVIDKSLGFLASDQKYSEIKVKDLFGEARQGTIYKYTYGHGIYYMFLSLPDVKTEQLLVIGPYLSSPISRSRLLETGEELGISPKEQKTLENIFASIPIIGTNSHIFAMLEAFGETIWESTELRIVDIHKELSTPAFNFSNQKNTDEPDSVLFNMQMMEKRYQYENELMDAVSRGQAHKVNMLLAAFGEFGFEKRLTNQLRNSKNYAIIMNTLLRKAAERGGVHPLYLDSVSSGFAMKIEELGDFSKAHDLMAEMFYTYCRLVQKHSTKNFSPTVRKVILLIEADLSANLTLSSLAASQNVSAGYLSTVFKRETGKTLTEYISDKRIELASHLLASTHLQVQTIALHCGIMDVQYFSKIFKKKTGKTPKEYRDSVR